MTRKSRSVERDFLFQTIMEQIAIQGIAGCYHETAARGYFADREIEVLPCLSFDELFARMAADPALLGIAAIENTIAGSLLPNHELLQQSRARIIGEQKLRISHVLAALPGQTPDDIAEVCSHPIALMQCGDFLKTLPGMKIVERDDTAGSAREIAEGRLAGTAAICGADAARLYGLEILRRGIETNKHNFTRFLLLADERRAAEFAAHHRARVGIPLLRRRDVRRPDALPAGHRRRTASHQRLPHSRRIRRMPQPRDLTPRNAAHRKQPEKGKTLKKQTKITQP